MKKDFNFKECVDDFFRSTDIILNATPKIIDEVTNEKNGSPTDENISMADSFYQHLTEFVYYMEIRRDELKKFREKYHDEIRRVHFESLDSMNTD